MARSDRPTREPWGFGILGAGIIADHHRHAIGVTEGARLVGVAHPDRALYAEIERNYGVPAVSEEELLADPAVDVMSVCTPSGQHAAQVIRAAEAGKHVLVEKPMALTLGDADAMIAACRANGVTLAVCLQRRTEEAVRRVKAAVDAGALGYVTFATAVMPYFRPDAYFAQADWRGTWAGDGGGVLMNQGIHLLDLLIWFLGDPEVIGASAATLLRHVEVEDTAAFTLRFPGGALAAVAATTTAAPGFPHELRIHGDAGAIGMTGDAVTTWQVQGYGGPAPEVALPGLVDAGPATDPRKVTADGHVKIVANLVAALNGQEPLIADGEEGRRSLKVVLDVYRAAGLKR